MLANRTSRWSIGAALICIALLAVSWFLLIIPRRADASDVRDQAAQADSQAATLQIKIARLKVQFADLPKQKAELAAITKQLPPGADVPSLVRDLQGLATQAGVSLDSITPGLPAVLSPGDPAVATTAAAGSVVSLPMNLQVSGDYFEAALFVKYLQTKIVRSYLITGLNASPDSKTDTSATANPIPTTTPSAVPTTAATAPVSPNLDRVSLTITGSVFVLLDGTVTLDDVTKAAKAAATGKTATPAPTSTAGAN